MDPEHLELRRLVDALILRGYTASPYKLVGVTWTPSGEVVLAFARSGAILKLKVKPGSSSCVFELELLGVEPSSISEEDLEELRAYAEDVELERLGEEGVRVRGRVVLPAPLELFDDLVSLLLEESRFSE